MSKIVIMYRTALYAQNTIKESNNSIFKAFSYDLIERFNKGHHIVDENNDFNTYSVIKK